MKTWLHQDHKPHTKLPRGRLKSYITFKYAPNKGRNGIKEVNMASKVLVNIIGQKSLRYLPTICRILGEKTPSCLLRSLVQSLVKTVKKPHQARRSSLKSGRQKSHCKSLNKYRKATKFSTWNDLFTHSLREYSRAHLLLPRLPSRSKRVSHFRLPGFIALSCQQDHPLGDPQQDLFSYFYHENLHRNETSHANISDGFGFSDLKLSVVCVLKLFSSGQKILAKQKCHFSLQEYLNSFT